MVGLNTNEFYRLFTDVPKDFHGYMMTSKREYLQLCGSITGPKR